jgi:hypothetical protein
MLATGGILGKRILISMISVGDIALSLHIFGRKERHFLSEVETVSLERRKNS